MAGRAAGIAGLDMTAQRRRAATQDSAPDLGLCRRKIVGGEVSRAVATQHLGQPAVVTHDRSGGWRIE